jgi:hypothetical protein
MSAPVRNDDVPTMFPATMYAPPWARAEVRDVAGDIGMAAVDKALNASDEFRRTLPPVAPLEVSDGKRCWRDKPFEGDIAVRHLRERPSLDPVAVPAPPMPPMPPMPTVGALARVAGAFGLAALAAFFVVGAMPQPLQGAANQSSVAAKPFWSRMLGGTSHEQPQALIPQPVVTERAIADTASVQPVAFADRLASVPVKAETEPTVAARAIQIEHPVVPSPTIRSLDPEEIALLIKRSEALIVEGDIAAARLMLTRAAEAGEARAAFALGATYDSDVLCRLGVLGVAADVAQARAWYVKAADFGSGEASRRLEQIAQSVR